MYNIITRTVCCNKMISFTTDKKLEVNMYTYGRTDECEGEQEIMMCLPSPAHLSTSPSHVY